MRKRIIGYYQRLALGRAAPRVDRKRVSAVLKVYQDFDAEVARFQKATGLRCPKGCGQCCDNPEVATTLLEGLVIAVALSRKKKLDFSLEQFASRAGEKICIFFKRQKNSGAGSCLVYPWRPLVCRAFGFSARQDKNQKNSLVTCRFIKNQDATRYERARRMIEKGLPAPAMADYFRRLLGVDLPLAQQDIPINQAIQKSLERIGLLFTMEKGSAR